MIKLCLQNLNKHNSDREEAIKIRNSYIENYTGSAQIGQDLGTLEMTKKRENPKMRFIPIEERTEIKLRKRSGERLPKLLNKRPITSKKSKVAFSNKTQTKKIELLVIVLKLFIFVFLYFKSYFL